MEGIFATISAAISPPSAAASSQLATRFWWTHQKLVILRAEHGTGRWVVTVDGKSVYDSEKPTSEDISDILFDIDGHSARVDVEDFPGLYSHTLSVDGQKITEDNGIEYSAESQNDLSIQVDLRTWRRKHEVQKRRHEPDCECDRVLVRDRIRRTPGDDLFANELVGSLALGMATGL